MLQHELDLLVSSTADGRLVLSDCFCLDTVVSWLCLVPAEQLPLTRPNNLRLPSAMLLCCFATVVSWCAWCLGAQCVTTHVWRPSVLARMSYPAFVPILASPRQGHMLSLHLRICTTHSGCVLYVAVVYVCRRTALCGPSSVMAFLPQQVCTR
jgi:hypothetical protein